MQEYYPLILAALIPLSVILVIITARSIKQSKNITDSKTVFGSNTLQLRLSKTKKTLLGQIGELLKLKTSVDEELLGELEETLIKADVGVAASLEIIERLRDRIQEDKITATNVVQSTLIDIIRSMMLQDYENETSHLHQTSLKPLVILFTGVNGVGKTTSIGKLAKRFVDKGNKVMLIAADTFRAAAIDQLAVWADRAGAEITRQNTGSDPSSVVYDGLTKAVKHEYDVVMIDTAGRQHTKVNLMNELNKIDRTIKKIIPNAPHESLLVIDATTGQNALTQAENFNQATHLSGLVLTKLDGTAKGGIVIGIKHQINIPVKLIGVGESTEDLRDFQVDEFLSALFD